MTKQTKETNQNLMFIDFEYFKGYFKQDLDVSDESEINNLIIRSTETILSLNNTDRSLISEWGTTAISTNDTAIIKQLSAMLVNKFYEMGIDKAVTSTSTSFGSQSVNYSFEDDNKLQDRFYNLFGQTAYYESVVMFDALFSESAEESAEFKTGQYVGNTSIETTGTEDPAFVTLMSKDKIIEYVDNKTFSATFLDGVVVGEVEWESKVDKSLYDSEQFEQDSKISTNTGNINAIIQTLEEKAIGEFKGSTTGGTITEDVWTPIVVDETLNTFENITYSNGMFTLTEDIENMTIELWGQANNTGVNKDVTIRLLNEDTSTIVGEPQTQTIDDFGRVQLTNDVSLPAGNYKFYITATIGGGTITFTNGYISILKFNGGGQSLVVSSEVVDDSETNPDSGLNIWKQELESTTAIATGNTGAIELLEDSKQDKDILPLNSLHLFSLNTGNQLPSNHSPLHKWEKQTFYMNSDSGDIIQVYILKEQTTKEVK